MGGGGGGGGTLPGDTIHGYAWSAFSHERVQKRPAQQLIERTLEQSERRKSARPLRTRPLRSPPPPPVAPMATWVLRPDWATCRRLSTGNASFLFLLHARHGRERQGEASPCRIEYLAGACFCGELQRRRESAQAAAARVLGRKRAANQEANSPLRGGQQRERERARAMLAWSRRHCNWSKSTYDALAARRRMSVGSVAVHTPPSRASLGDGPGLLQATRERIAGAGRLGTPSRGGKPG